MELRRKVAAALRLHLEPEYLKIDPGDEIYGTIVSTRFKRMPLDDRLSLIDSVLRDPTSNVTDAERRKVRLIVAYAPAEYAYRLEMDALDNGKPAPQKKPTRRKSKAKTR